MSKALQDAILNGLYDAGYPGHEIYGPKLLANNVNDNIWLTLKQELLTCKSFKWAVAFITQDMLVPFKAVMADLAEENISGTLITGDYLGFNDPKVFKELMKIPNLEIKIVRDNHFHAKGYFFEHNDYDTVIIGSANFTRSALLANYEWALRVSTRENATLTKQVKKQIDALEDNSDALTVAWLNSYQKSWLKPVNNHFHKTISQEIKPNKMQLAAFENLENLVQAGEKRGLVVSATGTGKTYLGAFAVKNYQPKRFLYIVHRQQIAKKSLKSFEKVLGESSKNFGILSGDKHDLDSKYLFATVQTISQDKFLKQFLPDEFDYILIDEAHRSASPSYQKVLNYFKPKFLLGMTATPERMDNQDVYKIFDYNLAYEIRLKSALEEKMLTPFHYVGVQDYEQNGEIIDETTNLRYLTADARVKYVLRQLDYYGYCGDKPCGLIFCSRQEEAKQLADKFTLLNHKAIALTNEDNERVRQKAISKLKAGQIEYIVTVDLFNEGIDISELNQIIMLRNTQSSIVFIQQLGRGLRKYPGKDFTTVIDFIGNYKNNYLIPIALNGDKSCDRDQAKREVKLPNIIGLSTINFDRISSEKILESISKTKLDSQRELRKAYDDLKQKLGRPPLLFDFEQYGSVSPLVFAKNSLLKHYGIFLQKMGEDIKMSKYESQVLFFMTKELLNGKRPHELILLDLLFHKNKVRIEEYQQELKQKGIYEDQAVLNSVDDILNLSFFDVKTGKTTKKAQYGNVPLVQHDLLEYQFSPEITAALRDSDFSRLFKDVIQTGLLISEKYDWQEQFTLYKQYDREDVCRLLNWPLDVSAPMYGYHVGDDETPIFITYKKESDEKRNAVYDNSLTDGRSLRWYTRSPRHLDSPEVEKLLNNKEMKIHLFVKRSDAAGKEFFYLGQAQILPNSVKEEQVGPHKKAAVGMDLLLKQPLSTDMYNLLFDD